MLKSLAALATALLVVGCTAAAPTAPSAPTASTSASASSAPATSASATPVVTATPEESTAMKVVEISLKNGKATPNGDRVDVDKGTILRLQITSDRNDEVHVHGYDVEIAVKAGASVTKDITLDQVGRFEIESHEPALTLLVLQVR